MIPLRDSNPTGKFPFWVIVIIAINLYVFYLEITSLNPDLFIANYALIPALLDFGNWESLRPLITSQFLHGGFLHIISNMLFLWVFGDNVEAKFGELLFPVFYLAAGVVGALTQYFFAADSFIPMLGASGAIAGVLGAYFAMFPNHKVDTLVPIFGFPAIVGIPASLMLFYWFFTQIFSGVLSIGVSSTEMGGVAFFAHIGGFAFGWLVAKIVNVGRVESLE